MKFKLEFAPQALADLRKTAVYYHDIRLDLSAQFLANFYLSVEILKTHPFFQVRYKNVRCLNLKSFPFMIHYIIDEDLKTVHILAVINTNQNPENSFL